MGSIALIARTLGHEVSGSDANVYPPMSTQLEVQGITLIDGYKAEHLNPAPDLVIIGNTLSRGNPAIEYVLDQGLAYCSGPEWLREHVLNDRHVLAVSGTHGKTTTTTILTWLLDAAGLNPGFLIGGIAENFHLSSRYTDSNYFVIEADEYDTALFDKRSKFIHYCPNTLIINNMEFDHADIFKDIEAIQTQFHHLIKTIPGNGLIISRAKDENIQISLDKGCWTPVQTFSSSSGDWTLEKIKNDHSQFKVMFKGKEIGEVEWSLIGEHNAENALAAIAAAKHVGVDPKNACESLKDFKSVKRRLEKLGEFNGITVYDDFAHHPTAIELTLKALRQKVGKSRIIAILEPRSNTMKSGVHQETLGPSLQEADQIFLFQSDAVAWDLELNTDMLAKKRCVLQATESIIEQTSGYAKAGDHIIIMSNGGFEGIQQRLIERLQET